MEFITGRPLRTRLTQGALSDDEIVGVFAPLLAAVESAHQVGAVHRDLKPENIMLVPRPDGKPGRPEVKLLDFGVAKMRAEANSTAQPIKSFSDSLKTSAGAMMGTPAYMAPEQIRSASTVDQRADIYAIGIILFEALTGERPFQASSIADLMAAHLFAQPERPSVVSTRRKVPPRTANARLLDQVVLRMLAKDTEYVFSA